MRALSIKQPWLYCITDLDKYVENRTWTPPNWIVGKRIALHASKKMDDLMSKRAASELAGFKLSTVVDDMPLGAIVATAVLQGYIVTRKSGRAMNVHVGDIDDYHPSLDKWFFGPVGWVLKDIQKLAEPIPHRGQLGLWDVDPAILEAGLTTHGADKNGEQLKLF